MGNIAAALTLDSRTITTALNAVVTDPVAFPIGRVESLNIHASFVYGSSGTNFKAWVQTSFDGGTTWTDIYCFAGTTSSLRRIVNLVNTAAVTTPVTPTDGTLSDNTAVSGILGPLFRVKVTTTGTYAGSTTLRIDAVAR